jgi:hypothetical protein
VDWCILTDSGLVLESWGLVNLGGREALSLSHCRREQSSFIILVLADPCDSEQGRSSMKACEWERSCSCILGKLKKQVRCVSALALRPRLGAVGHVAGSWDCTSTHHRTRILVALGEQSL